MNRYENLSFLVDTLNSIQKIRQATGNRVAHLSKQGREDKVVANYHELFQSVEDDLVNNIAPLMESHPVWKWASQVKGVGLENLAKVVGLIEKVEQDGKYGVECFDTPSKLVRFCGFAVIEGKAEKRTAGQKLHYNSELRSMLWRLGVSLNMAQGKFYQYYLDSKEYLLNRYLSEGKTILPTPAGKLCPPCHKEVKVKTAKYCPDCHAVLVKKQEGENIIFEGHMHNQALRRTLRMFIIMLYTTWREELGLSVREPYPVEHLGHSQVLKPEDFCD